MDHLVNASEVEMKMEYGTARTSAQPVSRAKMAILEASKRDGEFSSDGRRTVHNIINQTKSHTQ